jgi:hypothetical protein
MNGASKSDVPLISVFERRIPVSISRRPLCFIAADIQRQCLTITV